MVHFYLNVWTGISVEASIVISMQVFYFLQIRMFLYKVMPLYTENNR